MLNQSQSVRDCCVKECFIASLLKYSRLIRNYVYIWRARVHGMVNCVWWIINFPSTEGRRNARQPKRLHSTGLGMRDQPTDRHRLNSLLSKPQNPGRHRKVSFKRIRDVVDGVGTGGPSGRWCMVDGFGDIKAEASHQQLNINNSATLNSRFNVRQCWSWVSLNPLTWDLGSPN